MVCKGFGDGFGVGGWWRVEEVGEAVVYYPVSTDLYGDGKEEVRTQLNHIPDRGYISAQLLEVSFESEEASRDALLQVIGLLGQ